MRYLCFTKEFEKRFKRLQNQGKKGIQAASQCQTIIELLQSGDPRNHLLINKRTKNGEYRIDRCIKYDLGNGYRLVTVRENPDIIISFIGTHDQTDQWLEHHRTQNQSETDQILRREIIASPSQNNNQSREGDDSSNQPRPDLYEDTLISQLDEATLKEIFSGLCR